MKNALSFYTILSFFIFLQLTPGCSKVSDGGDNTSNSLNQPSGSLLIIGGGNRPDSIINRIIAETNIDHDEYGIVLTMAGFDPDTSGYYGELQFREKGVTNIKSYDFGRADKPTKVGLDSLKNASLIYITGGVQSRFMEAVTSYPTIAESLENAYQNGAMISGTSAGAAVMSQMMITGDQKNYPEYTSTFYNLEGDNIVTAEGLGLIKGVIIDQHFVKRARNNRILTAVMEFPDLTGIGIDESTAIMFKDGRAQVIGNSQVLVYQNMSGTASTFQNKIGAKNLQLDVYLPGDIFEF